MTEGRSGGTRESPSGFGEEDPAAELDYLETFRLLLPPAAAARSSRAEVRRERV